MENYYLLRNEHNKHVFGVEYGSQYLVFGNHPTLLEPKSKMQVIKKLYTMNQVDEIVASERRFYKTWYKDELEKKTDISITKRIINGDALILFFSDGDKVVVKREESDGYDIEKAISFAIAKKMFGSKKLFQEINMLKSSIK